MIEKTKILLNDLLLVYESILNAEGEMPDQFFYFCYKNKELLKSKYDEVVQLQEMCQPSQRYNEFQRRREMYLVEHCFTRNNQGQSILELDDNNQPIFLTQADESRFVEKLKILVSEFADDIVEYDTANNRLNEIKMSMVEMDVFKIPFIYIPRVDMKMREILVKHFCSDSTEEIEKILFKK